MSRQFNENPDEAGDPVQQELSDLVAYLDGELDVQSMDQMERRLVEEPPFRKEAERLDRTWQLLDSLEEVTASGEFLERTLSSMKSIQLAPTDAGSPVPSDNQSGSIAVPTSLGRDFLHKSIAMFASFALSFVLCGGLIVFVQWIRLKDRPSNDVEVLENLDVLRRFFQYDRVPDAEFLHALEVEEPSSSEAATRSEDVH